MISVYLLLDLFTICFFAHAARNSERSGYGS